MTGIDFARPWMGTVTGRAYPFGQATRAGGLRARGVGVFAEDVAHALAQSCRYNGQTRYPYSVAEHSLLVEQAMPAGASRELRLGALLHDAHEAYFGDITSPVKAILPAGVRDVEERVQRDVIYGLTEAHCRTSPPETVFAHASGEVVKQADQAVFAAERRHFFSDKLNWYEPVPPHLPALRTLERREEEIRRLHHKLGLAFDEGDAGTTGIRFGWPSVKEAFLARLKQLLDGVGDKA